MFDEEKVEEALEFCRDIKKYYDTSGPTSYHFTGRPLTGGHYEEMNAVDIPVERQKKKKKSILVRIAQNVVFVILCLIIAYGIARLLTDYVIQPTKVDGISMEETLYSDDILLIDRLTYRFAKPNRGDIIVFPYSMDEYYVKRIIGLPGEAIQIIDGLVYIDGEPLKEPYIANATEDSGVAFEPVLLTQDQYFVMGDNRNHSTDSRSNYIGPIEKSDIIGKVMARIYPFSAIHKF